MTKIQKWRNIVFNKYLQGSPMNGFQDYTGVRIKHITIQFQYDHFQTPNKAIMSDQYIR